MHSALAVVVSGFECIWKVQELASGSKVEGAKKVS